MGLRTMGGPSMSKILDEAIAEIVRTTPHGFQEISAIAAVYPDAEFLRFVVRCWDSVVRLSVTQIAEIFYKPVHPIERAGISDGSS